MLGSDFASSVWLTSSDALWHSTVAPSSGRISHARRHSITSDSGDTGIGTSCSDSLEDHPTSGSGSTFKPAYPVGCLSTHVMPSTPRSSMSRHREEKLDTSRWTSGYSLHGGSRHYGLSSDTCLDMKDSRPIKKWSSLSKLSGPDGLCIDSHVEKTSSRHSLEHVGRDNAMAQQSRGHRTSCLHHSMEQLKLDERDIDKRLYVGVDCKYKYDTCNSKALANSAASSRRHTLDMTYSALPESKPSGYDGHKYNHYGYHSGIPIQSSVRTQMWLSDQLHSNSQDLRTTEESSVLSSWQPLEHLQAEQAKVGNRCSQTEYMAVPLSQDTTKLDSLMQGLMRKKETVIDRQKQQLCHLQAFRGMEPRASQPATGHTPNEEDSYLCALKESMHENCKSSQNSAEERITPHFKNKEELGRKLVCAEADIAQVHEPLTQRTSKSSEESKKLEEKLKTRDKYINSLRKKCQKESEVNREKQRRIETLEKYLADLPTLDDVQKQSQQLHVIEEENKQLKETIKNLEKCSVSQRRSVKKSWPRQSVKNKERKIW
ncbi:hypothetical protein GDO86_009662 [Hymenochirus boettgeri]|uniref:Centrosomal protein of 85 kDa-like n=1 Tax=Hymenochirus boettgeri TaxID=247094 RepID=A0A8T2JMM1_9PIPI|nr:hypothetical protein GDO86_009662 [Hymenochirus boettgeri]